MSHRLDDTRPRPAIDPTLLNAQQVTQQIPPAQHPVQPQGVPPYGEQNPYPYQQQQPPLEYTPMYQNELPAPPKFLLWAVIGLFVLGIVGTIGSVVIFRNVLMPSQQERVMGVLPFMEAFLPPRPGAGDTLPTLESPNSSGISPSDLLNLGAPTGETSGEMSTEEVIATEEVIPTEEIVVTEEVTATVEAVVTEEVVITQEVVVTEEVIVTEEATPEPTPEPTQLPVQAPATEVSSISGRQQQSFGSNALLTGITFEKQTWNNCGPANITMALSFYGWQNRQAYAESYLKWGREDKNVSPHEMVAFVNEYSQLRSLTRMGGDVNMLKAFLSNNIPVIIETGYYLEGTDWLGHYQTLVGYDESMGNFIVNDSNIGANHVESYNYFDRLWQHFNREFIVIYRPEEEALVNRILGERVDPVRAAELAMEVAQAEVQKDPNNAHAWFNLGTSLNGMGDTRRAAVAYTESLRFGKLPFRMLWYQFGIFEAFYAEGRYQDIISLVEANLTNTGEYVEEIHYWHGMALAAMEKPNEARTAFRRALGLKSNYAEARAALDALPSA